MIRFNFRKLIRGGVANKWQGRNIEQGDQLRDRNVVRGMKSGRSNTTGRAGEKTPECVRPSRL